MAIGAYIHIPFCAHKCEFCDFAAFAGLNHLEDEYTSILCHEIEARAAQLSCDLLIDTIFYGGGTPGLIEIHNLERVHSSLLQRVRVAPDAEITLETTPHAITRAKARAWKSLGVNRLSIGIESLIDAELKAMGRDHTRAQAWQGIDLAVEADFAAISLDLMYGLPTQTDTSWSQTLGEVFALAETRPAIKHVSAYGLHLADHSPLWRRFPMASPAYPDDGLYASMYETLVRTSEAAGFFQYELSNFAKPGYQCRHNLCYWLGSNYLAFGVSAHRYWDDIRSSNWRSLKKYMEDPLGHETSEVIDAATRAKETIMLSLRLTAGLDLDRLNSELGVNLAKDRQVVLSDLKSNGYIEHDGARIALSRKGMLVSNSIIAALI